MDYTLKVPALIKSMAEAVAEPQIRADFEQSLRNLKRVLDERAERLRPSR